MVEVWFKLRAGGYICLTGHSTTQPEAALIHPRIAYGSTDFRWFYFDLPVSYHGFEVPVVGSFHSTHKDFDDGRFIGIIGVVSREVCALQQ
jgi:hypothetical protein